MDVLFDFDRAIIRQDALPVLEANAKRLQKEGVTRLLLEGRGDEAGTAAYNIILGDRRARTVKFYLQELGLQSTSRRRAMERIVPSVSSTVKIVCSRTGASISSSNSRAVPSRRREKRVTLRRIISSREQGGDGAQGLPACSDNWR